MKILTLCGSLRRASSNQALLSAWARLAPAGFEVEAYSGMGCLPHYNPDIDQHPLPESVVELRDSVRASDFLLISTPEYIHALPGSFKNLLEWLVSDPSFPGKRVVLLHVDRGSSWAYDSLREVLQTMSASTVDEACVGLPLRTNRVDAEAILEDPTLSERLQRSVAAVMKLVESE